MGQNLTKGIHHIRKPDFLSVLAQRRRSAVQELDSTLPE